MKNKNTGLKIMVIILSVLVVALSGYIVYDKVLSDEEIKEENTNEDIDLNNNQTNNSNNNISQVDNNDFVDFIYTYYEKDNNYDKNLINKLEKAAIETYDYITLPGVFCGETEVGPLVQEGNSHYNVSSQFDNYNDMLEYLKKYMSEEVIYSKLGYAATDKKQYLEKNDKLYCEVSYKGDPYSVYIAILEVTNYADNKIESNILFLSHGDMGSGAIYTYRIYKTTFEKINNNWIVTKFNTKDTE